MLFEAGDMTDWIGTASIDTEAQLRLQCEACPYQHKCPNPNPTSKVDILFISEKGIYPIFLNGYKTQHIFDIECLERDESGNLEKPPPGSENCCLGRALSAIINMRPQIVCSVDYSIFKKMEKAFGQDPQGFTYRTFLPTKYTDWNGDSHKFWHLSIDQFDIHAQMDRLDSKLRIAMENEPTVMEGNSDGLEYIYRNEDIGPAFDWIKSQKYNGLDLETTGLRPYAKDSEILSAAIGTHERTLCFPIQHPQTPSDFDWIRVLKEIEELPRHTGIIAHNSIFELEQLSYRFGLDFLYAGRWQDTMAQAYILFTDQSKDLNSCIRREFGFNLKRISSIDVKNLRYIALDRVLEYNGLDTKYTELLWHQQNRLLEFEGLVRAYEMQIDRIPPVIIMQIKGMIPNESWIQTEGIKSKHEAAKALQEFAEYPEVQRIVNDYGKCEPLSGKDLGILFDSLGIKGLKKKVKDHATGGYKETISYDAEFLAKCKHPIAKVIDSYREHSKKYTTWVQPFSKNLIGGGAMVHDDGLIHPQHNSMKVITGRFSCTGPNCYAWPSRGGGKVSRNVFWAGPGNVMTAADLGQIEFRLVAAMTEDAEMIKSIWQNYDVHMVWAHKIVEKFPGIFVQDPTDKKQMKEFRSLVKNKFTFPLVYRSLWSSVARDLGVGEQQEKMNKLISEFFEMFSGLAKWQEKMLKFEKENGYIVTPFGRKYRGPLREQQTCNWAVQGTAFDYMCAAMCRMSERGVEENKPWLSPCLFIYDDLTHVIPEEHAAEAAMDIVREITRTDLYSDWLTVPIEVELQMGKSWGSLKDVGKYSSHEIWK